MSRAPMTPARDIIFLGCYGGRHDWQFTGGCNAGCGKDCSCSVPVYLCAKCGDWDYGDNGEATEIRRNCAAERISQRDPE